MSLHTLTVAELSAGLRARRFSSLDLTLHFLGRIERVAPDPEVLAVNPNCPRTPNGSVSRRARIHFCLARQGHDVEALAEFVDADVTNVIDLFEAFNAGTHGTAGKLSIGQLIALKERVQDAVRFVHSIAFGLS